MAISVEPLTEEFVAVVRGIDLSQPVSEEQVQEIERLIWRYGVLYFPNQPVTAEEQVRFAGSFGLLATGLQKKILHKVQDRLNSAAITDISNINQDGQVAKNDETMALLNIGNMAWHTDASYEHHPYRYGFLAAQTAVSWGGNTEFADLRAAYDALDHRTQALIADKTAVFYSHNTRDQLGFNDSEADRRAFPPARWPIVRTHPGSGRKLLWIDSKVTEISGMSIPEGRAFALEMIEHIGQRERVHSHSWTPGDLIMWDNRSVLHRGRRFDLSEKREMRRVSTVDDSSSLGLVGTVRHAISA